MDTANLKKFAQHARVTLLEQVNTKLNFVLAKDSLARREHTAAVTELEAKIAELGRQQLIERVAYIWFNRFSALRYMDVNLYTRIGTVSPAEGQTQPEILAEAKMGHIDAREIPENIQQQVLCLLDGTLPSDDPQAEAYRLLLVATCNYWHSNMPFLFQRIDDYTQLLMPDNLLSTSSILTTMREAMTVEVCEDVEVIGWLYQFYISDKKDEVFAGLKKNEKVTPENIPAATQLFTPHWIVRYLVENSLGRLWLLNHPESALADSMEYYIKPAEDNDETEFLRVERPEDLKICDPACGSGHMLTYAFDLLYKIYEEQGHSESDIPSKILTHNLYGIELDERAGELAAFALTMKARAKQKRFFSKKIRPNICVLEAIKFDKDELDEYMDFIGRDLFNSALETTLHQFEEADNLGSLIRPALTDVTEILAQLESKDVSGQLFLSHTHEKVLTVLKQTDYLSPRYHIVTANPPYMGSRGMNERLTTWAKNHYPNSNADLYSMFIERVLGLIHERGYMGMITLPSWLFLDSFNDLRYEVLNSYYIESMLHMGRGIFGIDWGSTAFIIAKLPVNDKKSNFFKLHKKVFKHIYSEDIEKLFLKAKSNPEFKFNFDNYRDETGVQEILEDSSGQKIRYIINPIKFKGIPGNPIAYWFGDKALSIFSESYLLDQVASVKTGMTTADNNRFVRNWSEVSISKAFFDAENSKDAESSICKWFPYNKGGGFRRWYGLNDNLINWENDGYEIKNNLNAKGKQKASVRAEANYFKPAITYSSVTSNSFSARLSNPGFLFDSGGSCVFCDDLNYFEYIGGILCSKIPEFFLAAYNDTINFQPRDVSRIPIVSHEDINVNLLISNSKKCLVFSKNDWDSYETSWDFTTLPLLDDEYRKPTLADTYKELRSQWQTMTAEMQRLEEDNNRIFIKAYGLEDELTPDVPLKEITLTCNPHYRYGGDKTNDELEALLLADTMRELISYAVGCMFGRYSLDKPGLVLANQGDTIEDYYQQIPEPSYAPDKDNVLPILDGEWFSDDIVDCFRRFMKTAFGDSNYNENIQFIEMALGKNGKPRDIRDYFLKDFYDDHIKRYKKRPIYWMFSSGDFNALIYMHRYRLDTASVVLNEYLREFRIKIEAHKGRLQALSISSSATEGEKTKAIKEIAKINKLVLELEEYERDTLYPLATKKIEIDLDDGVKANYPKLGSALKSVKGLS